MHRRSLPSSLRLLAPGAACAVLLTGALYGLVLTRAEARQVPAAPGSGHSHLPGMGPEEPGPLSGSNASKLEHMRQDDRRKHLMSDTNKLLQLSTELKTEVEKTSKDELSLDVVRKAAEIEKLAHDVKERMKD